VLINWFLSREGQAVIQKGDAKEPGPNSLREDIPKDDLPIWSHRQRGTRYIRLWGPDIWDRDAVRKFVSEQPK
jgi:hypothetical protein